MKKYGFAVLLPVVEVVSSAGLFLMYALRIFLHLKAAAHGTASASLVAGEFQLTVASKDFLSAAFQFACWPAEHFIVMVNAPAKYVQILVSLVIAQSGRWEPGWISPPVWHCLTYSIYAVPAWYWVGRGVDGLLQRGGVRTSVMVASAAFGLISAGLFGVLRFGLSAADRQSVDTTEWLMVGFALWTVLFGIPVVAWLRQGKASGGRSVPGGTADLRG